MAAIHVFVVAVSILSMIQFKSQVNAALVVSRDPEDALYVTEGKVSSLSMNVSGLTRSLILTVTSADEGVFTVEGNDTFLLDVADVESVQSGVNDTNGLEGTNVTIVIQIKAVFIGIENLLFSVSSVDTPYLTDDDDDDDEFHPHLVKVKRKENSIVDAFNYILVVWLIFSYISMGATMDWRAIWEKLKKPYGVIIGLLCQFIIMPAVAFSLTKLSTLGNAASLGLVIIGCCPGGWVSNIYSLLLDCDLILSITMTACSTILALGTMPLNLFIYGTSYTTEDDNLSIPYDWVFIQILMLIIPVLFGMVLYYKAPRVAERLGRFLRLIAIIMIVVGLSIGLPANIYAFYAPLNLLFVALLLPIIGSVLGLLLAKASCLYNTSAVTVALETGSQNTLLGALIAQFSFKQPEADLISRVPLMVAMFTMAFGALVTLIYSIFKKCPGKIHAPEKDGEACEKCGNALNQNQTTENNAETNVGESQSTRGLTSVDNKINPEAHENGGFAGDETPLSVVSNTNGHNELAIRPTADLNGSNNNSNFENIESTYF